MFEISEQLTFLFKMEIISTSQSEYSDILSAARAIKSAVIESRYITAKLVNKEIVTLYYNVGRFISARSRLGHWGTNAISRLSVLLCQELPGLRGFSETNIKNMRIFFEEWQDIFENRQASTADFSTATIADFEVVANRQLTTADLTPDELSDFFSVAFTHHREILRKANSLKERLFYIQKCASEFWSVKRLQKALTDGVFRTQNVTSTNFPVRIDNELLRRRALQSFKENYVFDFVELEEDEDLIDEKVLEAEIVKNIKNFIMAFGQDFAYMGNQYRLHVDGQDYFVDLLFYHRGLRCLVAIELKRGAFKAPYAGQLNLYLSALDEYVKRPDENPSIGIILCKEKSDKTVEFAFRNMTSPMGVATYTLRKELPEEYKNALPNPDDLKQFL